MGAVFKREFKAYFTNPLGYIILAVSYLFLGIFFSQYYAAGAPYVEFVVLNMAQILLFIIPAITMRLFSEESRQKTNQVLFTAPVKLINIVLGKFFAAMSLYALCFVPTVIYQIIVSSYVSVNLLYYIYSLIGILLFGASLIAIGMFISSLTESQVLSIVFTIVLNIFILFSSSLASSITVPSATAWYGKVWAWLVGLFVKLLNCFDFLSVIDSFVNNTFVLKDIVFFISIAAAFVFLTERSLERRRWS